MRAVVFDNCFGWLHPAAGGLGVVVCQPLGHEAIWLHEGVRQLAQGLADAGMPALRFDYRGTGDSAGDETAQAQSLGRYADDIVAAAAYLKAATGVERIALCGVRMGASLAALVAHRIAGIEALVMLAPVTSGRQYLRELKMLQRTFLDAAGPFVTADQLPGEVEALGHRSDAGLVAEILAMDLQAIEAAPAPRVLVLSPGARSGDAAVAARYEALGSHARVEDLHGFDAWMVDPVFSVPPEDALARVVAWFADVPALLARRSLPVLSAPRQASLHMAEATEHDVSLGPQGVFGMLCVPSGPRAAAPAVVFINIGKTHHIGSARFAVTYARQLACAGVTSLRIDVGGIGDSAPADSPDDASSYSPASLRDVHTAVDWLAAHTKRRVVVFGICSGAYLGLHAAVDNPNIAGAMLVNLEWFFRPTSPAKAAPASKRGVSTRQVLISLRRRDKWGKVLRGESSLLPVAALLARGLAKRAGAEIKRLAARLHPAFSEERRIDALLGRLRSRGVYTRLVFGALDSGLDELETHFGKRGCRLPQSAHLQCTVFETMDHALFSTPGRMRMAGFLERFVFEMAGADPHATASGPAAQKNLDAAAIPAARHRGMAFTNGVKK